MVGSDEIRLVRAFRKEGISDGFMPWERSWTVA
jgi:hypothetical protein